MLVDVLPLGLTYVGGSAAGPAGWSAAYNGLTRELTFQAAGLTLATGSATLTYQVTIDLPPFGQRRRCVDQQCRPDLDLAARARMPASAPAPAA